MKQVVAIAALALAVSSGALVAQQDAAAKRQAAVVETGLAAFVQHPPAFIQGKRIGLITNPSGRDENGRSGADLLNEMKGVKLVALFAPEHGIRGDNTYGDRDEKTGLPVYTLFGATSKPTPEMLKDVDVLVYDIQDIGVRQYTFESTMALGMQAAAAKGIPYIAAPGVDLQTGSHTFNAPLRASCGGIRCGSW